MIKQKVKYNSPMAYYQIAKAYLMELGEQVDNQLNREKENWLSRFKRLFG